MEKKINLLKIREITFQKMATLVIFSKYCTIFHIIAQMPCVEKATRIQAEQIKCNKYSKGRLLCQKI